MNKSLTGNCKISNEMHESRIEMDESQKNEGANIEKGDRQMQNERKQKKGKEDFFFNLEKLA